MGRMLKTTLTMVTMFLFVIGFGASTAKAFSPEVSVQGYLKSGGTGLNGSYDYWVFLKKNSTVYWGKKFTAQTISSGVFTQSLSGAGDNLSADANLTGAYQANFSGYSITTFFNDTTSGDAFAATVKVNLGSGNIATFDGISLSAVPMAMTANQLSKNGATSGQYLKYGGSSWAPASIVSADISDAASTNTASKVVVRDGSGNFAAGTITASLTGNVTGNVTGNLTGDVTGNVTGNVAGNVTGNVSGTAANVTGTVAVANGGTGQTTQQAALNALAGGVTSGQFLRGDGTNVTMSAITAGDVPTLNQNTTGTAANVTGTVAIANGGTGSTTAGDARTALGVAASGANSDITSLTAVTSVASSAGLTVSSAAGGSTTVGDNTGAAATTIRSGTGNISVDPGSTGTLTLGNSAGTGAIGISTGTGAQAVNIGTGGTGAKTVTIGNSTVAASATVVVGGSTGGVKIGGSGTTATAIKSGILTCSAAYVFGATQALTCTGMPSAGAGWICTCNIQSTTSGASITAATVGIANIRPGYSAAATAAADRIFVTYTATGTAATNMNVGCICIK